MFRTIAAQIERDRDASDRTFTLEVFDRVLNGAFYDHLPAGFHHEVSGNGEYVPLRSRRPSVQYGLCRIVAEDSVALLFSEGHFPTAECKDEKVKASLADVIKDLRLNEIMMSAATTGSVGSVALHLRILLQDDGTFRPCVEVRQTGFLTPEFNPCAPHVLARMREKYKCKGAELKDKGYAIADADLNSDFWFARDWDTKSESWYLPWKLSTTDQTNEIAPYTIDTVRTVTHDLGFVPWIWIRKPSGPSEAARFPTRSPE
jgi:hypothetical protein